jgi:hypothetical protein
MLRAIVIATLLCAAVATSAQAAPADKRCGDLATFSHPDRPQRIRAHGLGCHAARTLARKHFNRIGLGERCDLNNASCVIGRFTCARSFFGNSGTRVRCTAPDGDRVRFIYGV